MLGVLFAKLDLGLESWNERVDARGVGIGVEHKREAESQG